MPVNEVIGNDDIWTEILSYFTITFNDSVEEMREKRIALLCIALLSQELTDAALECLWKTMTSLQPLVGVLNSKARTAQANYLEYQPPGRNSLYPGRWDLRKPLDNEGQELRNRMQDFYLPCIQNLRLADLDSKEVELWDMLTMCLRFDEGCAVTLLPGLRSLSLDLRNGFFINSSLCHIISARLENVTYIASTPEQVVAVEVIQNLLKTRECVLKSVSFEGIPTETQILPTLLKFEHLETLGIDFQHPASAPQIRKYTSGPTVADILTRLPNLRALHIDLRPFKMQESSRAVIPVIRPPDSLDTLLIKGTSADLEGFLDVVKSENIMNLSVMITQVHPPKSFTWKKLCHQVALNYPLLDSLTLRCSGNVPAVPKLVFKDFTELLPREMKSFCLDGILHCFTEADVRAFFQSWSNLRILKIVNESTDSAFDASLLEEISIMKSLEHVTLPIDFSNWQTRLSDDIMSSSNLQRLTLTQLAGAPLDGKGQTTLVWNLCLLFPMLHTLDTSDSTQTSYIADLKHLISLTHGTTVIYLRKQERMRRHGQT